MNKKTRLNLQLISAVGIVIIGCILLIFGFVVPPLGVINNSVLVAFGETCTFAGALFGVDYNYKYKIHISSKSQKDFEN